MTIPVSNLTNKIAGKVYAVSNQSGSVSSSQFLTYKNDSYGDIVHDNIIKSPTNSGIQVNTGAAGNTFFHNTIIDAPAKKAIVTDIDSIKGTDSKKQIGIEIDNKNTSQSRFNDNIVTANRM